MLMARTAIGTEIIGAQKVNNLLKAGVCYYQIDQSKEWGGIESHYAMLVKF